MATIDRMSLYVRVCVYECDWVCVLGLVYRFLCKCEENYQFGN